MQEADACNSFLADDLVEAKRVQTHKYAPRKVRIVWEEEMVDKRMGPLVSLVVFRLMYFELGSPVSSFSLALLSFSLLFERAKTHRLYYAQQKQEIVQVDGTDNRRKIS